MNRVAGGRVDYRVPLPVTTLLTIQAVDPDGLTANGFMENHPVRRFLGSTREAFKEPWYTPPIMFYLAPPQAMV